MQDSPAVTVEQPKTLLIELREPQRQKPHPHVLSQTLWEPLILSLTTNAQQWVRLNLADLPGRTNGQKQSNVHGHMVRKLGTVQTRIEDGHMYVRLVKVNRG